MKRMIVPVFATLAAIVTVSLLAGAARACEPPNCWGAIAWNPNNQAWGMMVNLFTPAQARAQALARCRGCREVQVFRDACFAVAIAPKTRGGFGAAQAATEEDARLRARLACGNHNPGVRCRILTSACTLRSYLR